MERSIYRIFLDIRDSHKNCVLDMKQTDNHRRLRITLTDGGQRYPITDSCYAVFTAKKPDSTVIYNLCTLDQGDVIYDITPQTTAVPGVLDCEIRLLDAGKPLQPDGQGILPETKAQLLTSAAFGIRVHPTVYDENATLASSSEVSALSDATARAMAIAQVLEEALRDNYFHGISATHSWDGTVLTVTSASGTSSANLQGPKGPKGDTGPKGEKGDKGDPSQPDLADDTVGSKGWSSKNILDRLCPSFTASGMLVHCEPALGYPMEVSADGDFSYVLTVCGKNLYDSVTYPMVKGYMIRRETGNFYESAAFSATEGYIPVSSLRGKTLFLRKAPNDTNPYTNAGLAFYNNDKQYISGVSTSPVTVPDNAAYLRFSINSSYVTEAQLTLDEPEAEPEAYCGVSYTVDPGDVQLVPALPGTNTLFAHLRIEDHTPLTVSVAGRSDPVTILNKLTQAVRQLGGDI